MSGELIQLLKEALQTPGFLKEIYGDLAKPGIAQVGKALETVFGFGNTLLLPLAWANERSRLAFANNIEKYRRQIETIPIEKITTVPPEIGVPILEKLRYISDDELSDLYVNLLAKASTTDSAHFAHPSFVNIISNLSPDEAVLLKEVRRQKQIPFITIGIRPDNFKWSEWGDLLTMLETTAAYSFPQNLPAYFSNFAAQGLVQIRREMFATVGIPYEEIEEFYLKQMSVDFKDPEPSQYYSNRGSIELTPFGELFLDACFKKLDEE